MSTVVDQDWKAVAIAAADKREAERREADVRYAVEQNAMAAEELRRLLLRVGIEAAPTSGVLDLDGVRFSKSGRDGYGFPDELKAAVPCSDARCRNWSISWRLDEPADLGVFLGGHYQHTCGELRHDYGVEAVATEQTYTVEIETAEDRLAAAIRELVRDELREAAER